MPGTQGALRLIERTAVDLCRALSASLDVLEQAISRQPCPDAAVAEATSALIRQLHLRQAAWGPANGPLPLRRLTALAQGLPNNVILDLSALPVTTEFPDPTGRIVLNILLLAANSLTDGGQITVAGDADDLFIKISGPTAAWPIGLALCLANEAEALASLTDGPNLQMALTASLAYAGDIRLSAVFPPGGQTEPAILRLGR
jgi:hypothetical protein